MPPQKGTPMPTPYDHLNPDEILAIDVMLGNVMQKRTMEIENLRDQIKEKENDIAEIRRRHQLLNDVITSRPPFTPSQASGTDTAPAAESASNETDPVGGFATAINEFVSKLNSQRGK